MLCEAVTVIALTVQRNSTGFPTSIFARVLPCLVVKKNFPRWKQEHLLVRVNGVWIGWREELR